MYLFTFVTCFIILVNFSYQEFPTAVQVAVKSYGVMPDLIPTAPKNFIIVTYPGQLQIVLGNVVGLSQVQNEPNVRFYACEERYYTLFMLDPDVPSRTNTSLAQVRHWHVGNIPGDDVERGEIQAVYMGPMPDAGTGPHRYIFLVYRQEKKLKFTEPKLLDTSGNGRLNFNLKKFVRKYNLKLTSANFFQTEFANDECRQGYEPVEPLD